MVLALFPVFWYNKYKYRKGVIFVSVGQLLTTIDRSLVLELYKRGENKKLLHLGTYNLDVQSSFDELVKAYGDASVLHADKYKAYVLVYLGD